MLSEEEKKAIERMYDLIHACEVGIEKHGQYDDLFEKDKQAIETVLNLITRLEKELKEQTHKKTYARQNVMYKNKQLGQARNKIKKLQKENEKYQKLYEKALDDVVRLQKENEEKDEEMKSLGKLFDERGEQLELKQIQIDLMTKYIDKCNYVDSEECQFQYDFKIKGCIEKGDCIDCIKQYFENKAKGEDVNERN